MQMTRVLPVSGNLEASEDLAARVAEILTRSANEPGILEMNRLMAMTEPARQIDQAYSDMSIPAHTTQTTNSRA